jgi:hypothetical protein
LGFPTGWSSTTHKESSGAINHAPAALFLAPLPGRKVEDLCERSFRTQILYFVIVLLYFIYFTCIVLYQKPKKIRILGSCYFFTLVHHAIP